jgi:1-acyl-sn-glycerol-3-phosphate acyltransferase
MRPFYRFIWSLARIVLIVFGKLKLNDTENIPSSGGVVVASNHVAAIDPPILGSSINRPLYFMAKKELFDIVILGRLISSLNSIPVKRGVFDRNALSMSENALRDGFGLILFPEGTRSKTGELGPGKPGMGMLARKAEVPIMPVYIKNSKIFHKLWFTGKRLEVWFGKPISKEWVVNQPNDKTGYRAIVAELMDRIAALQKTAENKI